MNEQPLDLKGAFRAIWKMRILVVALVVLGLAAGVADRVAWPPMATARALVILPNQQTNAGAPTIDMSTQVVIALSTPVLTAAGKTVSPPLSAVSLKKHTAVKALSQDILQVQVSAKTKGDAVRLADSVATGYIAYVAELDSSTSSVISLLRNEAAQLTRQFVRLQNQINTVSSRVAEESARSAAGQRDAGLLASLRNEQQNVSLQLNSVNAQLVSAEASSGVASGAMRLLQKAALVPVPALRTPLTGFIGACAGLLLGCVFALVRSRRDQHLYLRDAIADAIGVPVLASIEAERCRTTKDWKRLLDRYKPTPVEAWTARRVLYRVGQADGDERPKLSVLAFSRDEPALVAAVKFAEAAAALGVQTMLVPGQHRSLVPLRAACATRPGPAEAGHVVTLGPDGGGEEFSGVLLTVSVLALDEAKPEVPDVGGAKLLAVSAGFADSEALARVALAASEVGTPIEGLLVVNPEPDDTTIGSLPQGDGEARQLVFRPALRPGADLSSGTPR